MMKPDSRLVSTTRGESSGASHGTALSALYQRWREPLVRLLRGRFGNRIEAEDATQQLFVHMAASGSLPEAGKELAYLSRSANHLLIDAWRKRGGAQAIDLVSMESCGDELSRRSAGDVHDPVRLTQQRQQLDRLAEAMAELPERQREAFMLHIIDGLTQDAVALQMGISLRMVSKHISRAYAYCELRLQYGCMAQMQRLRAHDRCDARADACACHRADCGAKLGPTP